MNENPMQISDSENGKNVTFPDFFDISIASSVREAFMELIEEHPEKISLNTAKTDIVDTAALQVLLAFIRDARELGIEVNITSNSDVVDKAVFSLGLESHLV